MLHWEQPGSGNVLWEQRSSSSARSSPAALVALGCPGFTRVWGHRLHPGDRVPDAVVTQTVPNVNNCNGSVLPETKGY